MGIFCREKDGQFQLRPIDRATTSARTKTQIRMDRLGSHTSRSVGMGGGRVINVDSSVPSTITEVVEVTEEERMEMEDSNNDIFGKLDKVKMYRIGLHIRIFI
ncbi:UNVERIFIED_CONTAM: hypothetical protein RMT77_012287 [Armadillidium vulgare]